MVVVSPAGHNVTMSPSAVCKCSIMPTFYDDQVPDTVPQSNYNTECSRQRSDGRCHMCLVVCLLNASVDASSNLLAGC